MKHTPVSRKAISDGRLGKVVCEVSCEICKKIFRVNPSKKQRNSRFFCGTTCLYEWRSKFGRFSTERNPRWKGGPLSKKCKLCGEIFFFIRKRKLKAKFCSQSCSAKFRFTGKRNKKWKGGISKHRDRIKASLFYKEWRLRIFRRDHFTCQECGYKGQNIEAHHIRKHSEFPRLTFKVWNGITLCKTCHDKTYGKEERFEERYYKKTLNDYMPSILRKLR